MRQRLTHRLAHPMVGFWGVFALFLSVMAFSTVPTPLYPIYAATEGFGSSTVSMIFAAYALGVLLSLLFLGHISDWYGRKIMLFGALGVAVVADVVFLTGTDVLTLVIARFVSGIAVGMLTATATATMTALYRQAKPDASPVLAGTLAIVANIGGLGVGPLVSGVLAAFFPAPLVVPYVVFGVALLLTVPALIFTPEPVDTSVPTRYRPQKLAVPHGARTQFWSGIALGFVSFAVFGLFTSLAPSLLSSSFGIHSPFVAGITAFAVFASAAVAQAAFTRIRLEVGTWLGAGLLIVGLGLIALQMIAPSYTLFLVAGIVAGAGSGLAFKASMAEISRTAEPASRAGALANLFLGSYLGLSVPVLGLGALAAAVTLPIAITLFAGVLAIALIPIAIVFGLGLRRGARTAKAASAAPAAGGTTGSVSTQPRPVPSHN
jgi:predicted MFS family arabinose efflux permease